MGYRGAGGLKNLRYYFKKILSIPIYLKILAIFLLTVIMVEFATITSIYFIFYKKEHLRIEHSGTAAAKIISYRVEDFFETGNMPGLKKMISYVVRNSTVLEYAVVRDGAGRVAASAESTFLASVKKSSSIFSRATRTGPSSRAASTTPTTCRPTRCRRISRKPASSRAAPKTPAPATSTTRARLSPAAPAATTTSAVSATRSRSA